MAASRTATAWVCTMSMGPGMQEGGYLSDILGGNLTATLAGFEQAR